MEQTFPFRNVYTGVERTRKRAVPEAIMVRLQKLDLTHSAPLAFSRDMFIFSYCTRGMAFCRYCLSEKGGYKWRNT